MRRISLVLVFVLLAPASLLSQERPHILLTNDDGIDAEGIQAMYRALVEIGRVTVAAPAANNSGIGHAWTISGNNPIYVDSRTDENGSEWHAIEAKPSDTVRLALHALLDEPPDIVVSGSNSGFNPGLVTYTSGTLGAAREAAFYGIPAIAVSVSRGETMDFESAAEFTARLVGAYLENQLPEGSFLAVTYPALPRDAIKGTRVVPLSRSLPIRPLFTEAQTPGGQRLFWPSFELISAPASEGQTDWSVLDDGYIAITPMQLDQTNHDLLRDLRRWGIEP